MPSRFWVKLKPASLGCASRQPARLFENFDDVQVPPTVADYHRHVAVHSESLRLFDEDIFRGKAIANGRDIRGLHAQRKTGQGLCECLLLPEWFP